MLTHPQNFYTAYLPSIPHDDDYEVLKQLRAENNIAYTCKNGHYYTIANCQRPVIESTCPTCKTKIGGISHKLSEGNKIMEGENEKIEHGYCVQEASKRAKEPESIRNMGSLNTIILRLMLDCTLYLSSLHSEKAVKGMLSENKPVDVAQFFADQVVKDVKILAHCLQHSPDESLLLIHHMLYQVKLMGNKREANGGGQMSSKEARNEYEGRLCREFITNVIGNDSGNIIQKMTEALAEDARSSGSNQLFKIAYDLLAPVTDDSAEFLNNRKFW